MDGFLNLLKPPGMTSSDAVVTVRRSLPGKEKVGHAGTLDPEAAGVLPIMIGKASRLFDLLADKQKTYIAEIALGAATDTQDAQGVVVSRGEWNGDFAALEAALPRFTGTIEQLPPAYSAIKTGGVAAYKLARAGVETALKPRPAQIDALELLETTGPDSALLRIRCGRGVYIRTLCHDIGAHLGCGAHMRFLLRAQSGPFTLENAVTLEEWLAAGASEKAALLAPMDLPLAQLPAARLPETAERVCRDGKALTKFLSLDEGATSGGTVRVYCGERFAGLARWNENENALRFFAMLL